VKVRVRRRVRRPPDLTSLFDVLFIVVFVALIRAAAAQQALAQATAPKPVAPQPPQPPPDVAALRSRALASITADLSGRTPLVIRVSVAGTVDAIEADGKKLVLDVPLLEHDPNPQVGVSYLGDRSVELRVCRIAAVHLGAPDLAHYLVVIAPANDRKLRLTALNDGLDEDVRRCFVEQRGFAKIIEPEPPPP
jgi:hypothetical protein